MAKDFDSPAMPSIKPIAEPPDPRVIPLDRQESLTHNQVEQIRFGLGDTGPLAQAVMNSNISSLQKQLATGAISCLSTRRPADPVQGQMIFETDTKLTYFWDGTAWVTGTGSGAVLTPVGTIVPYAGTGLSTPAGWLFCAGQALNAVTSPEYAALYGVIGNQYGGTNNTNFQVPDLRGRVAAGRDDMGGTAQNRLTTAGSAVNGVLLGANGGLQNRTLSLDHVHYGQGQGGNIAAAIGAVNSRVDSIGYIAGGVTGPGSGTSTYAIAGGYLGTGNAFNHYTPVYGQTSGMSANAAPVVNTVQPTIITNYIIKAIADTVTGYAGTTLTGAAGGDLTGTYPNPTITNITNAPIYNSNTTVSFRTSSTERMSIDASGRVRKPFQPVATVYRTSSLGAGANIGWTGSYINTGSMFPGAGGVNFTVPVAGNYLFCVQAMSDNNSNNIYIDLYKNGVRVDYLRTYGYSSTNAHKQISFQVVLPAAANDYFYFRNEGSTLYGDSAGYSNALVMLVS